MEAQPGSEAARVRSGLRIGGIIVTVLDSEYGDDPDAACNSGRGRAGGNECPPDSEWPPGPRDRDLA